MRRFGRGTSGGHRSRRPAGHRHGRPPRSRLLLALLVLVAGPACSGGGCGGCGIEPIPGGYPIDERIENAAQVRLSETGIGFIETNIAAIAEQLLPDGTAFEVPKSSSLGFTICPDEDCFIAIEILDLQLTPSGDNGLQLHARLAADSRGPTREIRRHVPVDPPFGSTCSADVQTRRGDRDYVGVTAEVRLTTETRAARAGYTKLEVVDPQLAEGEGFEEDDLRFFDCGWSGIADFFKGWIVGYIEGQVDGMIQDGIDERLCTEQGEHGCPAGTEPEGGSDSPDAKCVFSEPEDPDNPECVPQLLGSDGQADFGALTLGTFSPGTHAPLQFLLASGGDGEAVNDGLSLFMYGGVRSTDRTFAESPAHNPCVPRREPPPLPEIERIETFRGNAVPGSDETPHFGLGISEKFLNYAGYGVFDSGMLCIGTGTRLSQQLSTGVFSLLVSSLNKLSFPRESAPVAIAIRPHRPPQFEIGRTAMEEPLLTVSIEQLALDFYVWSSERYIRFMTFQGDATLPIALRVEGNTLVPELGDIEVTNEKVSNTDLLSENPERLAPLLRDLFGMFAGRLSGSIDGFELPEVLDLELHVIENGIQGFEEGDDRFIGIFANLALTETTSASAVAVETDLELSDMHLDQDAMRLESWGQGELPYVHLWVEPDGPAGAEYEYSYRIDGMQWSRWQPDAHLVLEDRALLLQAKHVVEARARIAGEPHTADPTPARAELVVDLRPPRVATAPDAQGLRVDAHDIIAPRDALDYRYRIGDGSWTDWLPLATDPVIRAEQPGADVEIEVRDEAGNVGKTEATLIRGIPNPDAGGCDCAVPGSASAGTSGPWAALLAALGLACLGARRRARRRWQRRSDRIAVKRTGGWLRRATGSSVLLVVLGIAGCNCGGGGGGSDVCEGCEDGELCCEETAMCIAYDPAPLCEGTGCPGSAVTLDSMCNVTCAECGPDASERGLLATHLDMTAREDGSLVLSGYAPGVPPRLRYGDLVVGTYEPSSKRVDWHIVDGVPGAGSDGDAEAWRGGSTEAGPDVGRWSSIAHDASRLYVSYYDATDGALKLAIGDAGDWSTHVVDDEGDSGRYSSLLLDGGTPVVAYMQLLLPAEHPGRPRARVRVARASSDVPATGGDWTHTDVDEIEMACRPELCGGGTQCLEDGRCVAPGGDCDPGCGEEEVCFDGGCHAVLPDPYVEDMPPATGLYNALAATPDGMALVFYERATGNLRGARWDGTEWSAPFLIDGYERGNPYAGDSGIGASLFVGPDGVWHVTYVDGAEETLRYARIDDGDVEREDVDDGTTDGDMTHPDGRHIVGDDSSVVVTDDGEVRVVYQDATAQRAMLARRTAPGEPWQISVLDDTEHTGFWLTQQLVGNSSYIATWWRSGGGDLANGVRVLVLE